MKINHPLILQVCGRMPNGVKLKTMSFLFSKRSKKAIKWIWGFFAILIIISMIFAYSGGTGVF